MSEEWKSRVQRLADFWFLGYMLGKYQGEPLKPDHVLAFCQASFLMTLSWAGFLTLAPGTQIHVHSVSDAIQPSHPLSSPSPSTPNPSQHQRLFQWVSSSHQVAKVWSFSFSISPWNEHPWLISFRMDWLDLLAVQGTLKSLLKHHSSKASIPHN